ncbi:phosphopantetheine-binding protein [Streptomyces sp. NPDC007901]|uniref:phosphopantetheine-binding protein n=1 Tax=Streptomyces sp. NPDC007901 TaxID=3364785 RepID=UPI0036EEF1A5
MNAIEERLSALLTSRFGLSAEVDPDLTFGELDIDSISLVELAMISQEEFGVTVGDDDFTARHTLRTAAALLASKGAGV